MYGFIHMELITFGTLLKFSLKLCVEFQGNSLMHIWQSLMTKKHFCFYISCPLSMKCGQSRYFVNIFPENISSYISWTIVHGQLSTKRTRPVFSGLQWVIKFFDTMFKDYKTSGNYFQWDDIYQRVCALWSSSWKFTDKSFTK